LFLAAAVMLGGVLLVMPAGAQDAGNAMDRAAERTGDALRRAGDAISGSTTKPADQAMAPDVEDIRETLKEVTQAALTKGGFDDFVERFVDADRNRLGKDGFPSKDHTELDGRIAQLQKDWQSKYNQDFRIADKEAVFNTAFVRIMQGEIPESARLAGERTGASGTLNVGTTGVNASGTLNTGTTATGTVGARTDADKVAGGDTNREPGRNIATVSVAASHGLPAFNVPMIHEFPDRWKIDVPDDLTAQQLHDNLLKHLTKLNEQKDQWPTDSKDAYQMACHHVLMACMNVGKHGAGSDMMRQPGQTGTGMGTTNNPNR
jgi:hypothetical protein